MDGNVDCGGGDAEDEGLGFFARDHASLERHGIGAQPCAYCVGGVLMLRDAAGGALDVPVAGIARLRFGVTQTRTGVYHTARLFLPAQDEPLQISPCTQRCPQYGAVMRRLARAVAAQRGLAGLERGLTGTAALATFLVVLAIAIGASLMAWFVWRHESGTAGAMAFVVLMVAMVALCGWEALARDRPRPLRSLEELDRYLPRPR